MPMHGLFTPDDQLVGMDSRSRDIAGERHVFAEVEPWRGIR